MEKSKRRRKAKPSQSSLDIAKIAANAAIDTKAMDVVVLHVSDLVGYADYIVIASGRSTRQSQAAAQKVTLALTEAGVKVLGVEGERDGNWILVDAGSVVVHLFHQPVRDFYKLEKLYGDASCIKMSAEPG